MQKKLLRNFLKTTLYVLIVLTGAVTANAQSWYSLGPDDFKQPSYGSVEYLSFTLDGSGTPYIAYQDHANGEKVTVRKFDGTGWIDVGTPGFSSGSADYVSLAVNGTGTPYVAYVDAANGSKATVKKINGSSWADVGTAGISAGTTTNTFLAIDRSGTPYVAYSDGANGDKATVKKFNGSSWVNVGTPGFSSGSIGPISLALDGSGIPYVAYSDQGFGQNAVVKKFNGTSWVDVGVPGFSAGQVQVFNISMALDGNGMPYVAYQDGNNSFKATVKKFTGSSWVDVGTAGFSAGSPSFITLKIDGSGTPYIAFQEDNSKAAVKKFNGSSWVDVGTADFSAGAAYYTAMVLDGSGIPMLAYADSFKNQKVEVKKFTGSSWANVGTWGFSNGQADYISMKIDANGTPYVAYRDKVNSDKATVKKFSASGWINVGTAGFSAGQTAYNSLELDGSGTPYVAYGDGGKTIVKKFNGSSWLDVGTPSAGQTAFTSMTLDGSGLPYVAYADFNFSGKATVKRFNGSSWVDVGTPGFSAGFAQYTSLVLDGNGTPYIAYSDGGNGYKITVKKFNGSSWIDVGTTGFSAGQASYTSLAVNGTGTPYVAYVDYGNSSKATVKKFNGSSWVDVGTAGISAGSATYSSLVLDGSGIPFLAYKDESNSFSKATVKKFNGSSWVDAGTLGPSAGATNYTSLAISNGKIYLAYNNDGAYVKVYGANTSPSDISLSATALNENVAVNSTVGAFTSTDADAGNTHTYTLVAGTGSTDNASFNISGNTLRITASPDYEVKNSYSIRVRTTDQAGGFYEKAFIITINDVQETIPASTVFLSADTVNGLPGSQLVVPVRVRDFTNMLTAQGTITYNTSVATLAGVEQYGLPGLSASNFNTSTSGQITYSWDDATLAGVTLANDAIIFALRFNVVGTLGSSTPISFVNAPAITEFTNTSFAAVNVTTTNGSITVPANFLTTDLAVTNVCLGSQLNVPYTAGGTFSAGNVFTAQLSDSSGSFASPLNIGTWASSVSSAIPATIPAGTASGSGYRVRVISSAPALVGTESLVYLTINALPAAPATTDIYSCGSSTVTLTASGAPAGGFYRWYYTPSLGSAIPGETSAAITVPAVSPSITYYVSIVNSNGCESSRTAVTGTNVSAPSAPTVTGGSSCGPGSVSLMASGGGMPGSSFRWYTAASGGSSFQNISLYVTPVLTTTTTYYVSVISVEGCESARTPVTATINFAPTTPAAGSNSPLAAGGTLNLTASTIAGATYDWTGPNGFSSTQQNPGISNVTSMHAGVYSVTATVNGCVSAVATVNVSVTLSVAGTVRAESNAPVNTVSLTATGGSATQNYTTTSNGTYSFTLGQSGNYTVSAAKSNDVTANNGVTTLDIALIRRHILGIQALGSPYKLLAADVDASNAVSTADISQIRSLVLTTTNSFGGQQWKFVPGSHVFANPANPFPAPAATLTLNGLTNSLTSQDFVGIKLGDVNNTWDNTIARLTTAGNLELNILQQTALPGTLVTVPVKVKDFNNVSGYQFTLNWDAQVLAFDGINNQTATGAFGTHQVANGKLTTTWDNSSGGSTTLADGSVIFEVRFRVIGATGTSSAVRITSDLTKGVAYDQNLDQLNLVGTNGLVKVGSPTGISEAASNGYVLYQNQPNPFSQHTTIGFTLPKAEEITLEVYNSLGQVVAQHRGKFGSGEHQLSLEQFQQKTKLNAGTYFYQFKAGDFTATKRMVYLGE
jgi:hypothetical protein